MCDLDWTQWGVLGTWAQVIVGATTLYFLYNTLTAQNKSLIDQQKLTKLEHDRYLDSIMPSFKIDYSKYYQNTYEVKLVVETNYMFFNNIEHSFDGLFYIELKTKLRSKFLNIGSSIVYTITKTDDFDFSDDDLVYPLNMFLIFEDKLGTKYYQALYLKNGNDMYIEPPSKYNEV